MFIEAKTVTLNFRVQSLKALSISLTFSVLSVSLPLSPPLLSAPRSRLEEKISGPRMVIKLIALHIHQFFWRWMRNWKRDVNQEEEKVCEGESRGRNQRSVCQVLLLSINSSTMLLIHWYNVQPSSDPFADPFYHNSFHCLLHQWTFYPPLSLLLLVMSILSFNHWILTEFFPQYNYLRWLIPQKRIEFFYARVGALKIRIKTGSKSYNKRK